MLTKWIRSSTAAAVAALFANGEAGAVFIAQKPAEWGGVADLVTMYQDNLGVTPVTALEQTVGLHLDTRPIVGQATGPNTVGQPLRSAEQTNSASGFTSSTGWSLGAGWSIGGGVLTDAGGTAFATSTYNLPNILAGAFAEVTLTATRTSGGGSVNVQIVGGTGNAPFTVGASGTYRGIVPMPAGGGNRVALVADASGTWTGSFSALSVRAIYGNHRVQSSAGARARVSARYNKITARNANPVDLTNVTKAGDALATLTLVSDAASLATAGLSTICTLGNVYKLDNSAGGTNASATFGGTVGNTNTQRCSVYWRGTGLANIGTTTNVSGNIALATGYAQSGFTATSSAAGNQAFLIAQPGAVVFFVLMDMRESCYSYLPTPQVISGTGTAATDYSDTGFPARMVASGAQGYSTGAMDFSASNKAQMWFGGAELAGTGQVIYELSPLVTANVGSFALICPASSVYEINVNGGTRINQNTPAVVAPAASVLSVQWDCSAAVGAQQVARNNGAAFALTSVGVNTGAGPFGSAYLLNCFSRNNLGTGPGATNFTGDEFISIVRGGATPTSDIIASVERFVGQKMSINL